MDKHDLSTINFSSLKDIVLWREKCGTLQILRTCRENVFTFFLFAESRAEENFNIALVSGSIFISCEGGKRFETLIVSWINALKDFNSLKLFSKLSSVAMTGC